MKQSAACVICRAAWPLFMAPGAIDHCQFEPDVFCQVPMRQFHYGNEKIDDETGTTDNQDRI